MKYTSFNDALSLVNSGNNIFIQTACAAPQQLINILVENSARLKNVSIYHLHTEGKALYANPQYKDNFNTHCFFIGDNLRKAVNTGYADYIPVFISEIPALFRKKIINIDVALLHVSPPDINGYCSLGVSLDIALSVIENAKHLIAQVNPNMPRVHGSGIIHVSKFSAIVQVDDPIPEIDIGEPSAAEMKIADNIASLVEDGATLQMGIGKIPNAVLSKLTNHKKLGIHSEMFSDGVIDLVEKGVITGELKKRDKNKIIGGFICGTRKLYDYVNDNPLFELHDAAYVNDVGIIMQNPKVTAINSAIEIDLTGQVCADSIGRHLYSGVGGQMDFMRGASLSEGGKPIIAMSSTTRDGESKIVGMLKQGAGIVTTRANVHYVVTEYGIVNLYGKNIKQRIKELINIAHPNHRESLAREAFELWNINVAV
ncbi:MAG: acetyl-CoA hydrolase/transferase family protein [Bacteroidia bacterium]